MHRSRVYGMIIDVPPEARGPATAFWSAALGATPGEDPAEPQFTSLHDGLMSAAIQQVDDAPRYHLDIETDDVPAEVARLTGHGATEVALWQGCHVLRAPGGHLLCVVPVQSAATVFAADARTWP